MCVCVCVGGGMFLPLRDFRGGGIVQDYMDSSPEEGCGSELPDST